jgi:hypothetical protein
MVELLLLIVVLLLIVDTGQTLKIKEHNDLHEINWVLGEHPTDPKILSYFLAWIIGVIGAYFYLPITIDIIFNLIILLVEVKVIINNGRLGL